MSDARPVTLDDVSGDLALTLRHALPPEAVALRVDTNGEWEFGQEDWRPLFHFETRPVDAQGRELSFRCPETGGKADRRDFDLDADLEALLKDARDERGRQFVAYVEASDLIEHEMDLEDEYGEMDEDEMYADAYADMESATAEIIAGHELLLRFDVDRETGRVVNPVFGTAD
ncbi:MAG TPA: hypothetical protein VHN99_12055 [Deinococcales bacterium]|nr:hypothetical protein [Deinococcales bacterium]